MKRKYSGTVKDDEGNIITDATIAVYLAGSVTPASIYLDPTSATAVNSTTSDGYGRYAFYVSSYDYDSDQTFKIVISKTGYVNNEIDYITIEDVVAGTYTIAADKTISTHVVMPKGVILSVNTGITLTITGAFEAGLYQVFSGLGTVVFGSGSVSEIYSEWWGAVGDGATDDATPLQAALTASLGGHFKLLNNVYMCSTDLNIPGNDTKISGVRGGTILRFTGATDGLVLPDIAGILHRVVIEGLVLDTTNATAGKAIVAEFSTNAGFENVLRDITITNSGSGVWDYGLSTNDWQSSEVYSLRIYQSADCPVKIANASNELRFYGLEITGHATSTIGIDITGGASAEDAVFFGGTIQGTLAQACIRINNAKPQFYGFHIENTDTSPSLGGDVVFTGSGTGCCSFHGFRGGSFYTADGINVISAMISDSEVNDITWGTSCVGCLVMGSRIGTYTDGGQQNKLIGCTGVGGAALQNSFTGGFNNFSASDATPSVLSGDCWYTNNVAPTTITMFDDGIPGQRIVIVFQDGGGYNTTIDFTGTHLKGNTGADWSPAFQDWMECVFDGTDWFCSVHDCTA